MPLFVLSGLMLWFNIANEDGFNIIWRYFGWANQTLSIFTLWAISVYLTRNGKGRFPYMIAVIPAAFMTAVCFSYILTARIGFGLDQRFALPAGIAIFVLSIALFFIWKLKAVKG